jgi:medium-chain acyl-[acyl-carrier-protein] hydrolase
VSPSKVNVRVAILRSHPTTSRTAWFEHRRPAGKQELQLFCFPYAGAGAQIFHSWQRHLPVEVDLCLVNLPGRDKRIREPLATRLLPLVERIADAIVPELREPFALFGHSMGAAIGFELARELRRRQSIEPAHLLISGCRAPQWPRPDSPIYDLPHDEFIAELQKLNGTPKELLENPELMEVFLPVIRADFEMVGTYDYDPGEPLLCPITAYGGLQDTEVQVDSLQAWEQQTTSTFAVRMLTGDHFFIHNPNFPGILSDDLADLLPGNR